MKLSAKEFAWNGNKSHTHEWTSPDACNSLYKNYFPAPNSSPFIAKLLRRSYNDIQQSLADNPASIAGKLYTQNLILRQTLKDVTSQDASDSLKAHKLTEECSESIKLHPNPEERLCVLLDIIDEVQPVVAERIRKVKHWSLHSLVTALTGHCTHCSLHSLVTALTGHCTHWPLHSLHVSLHLLVTGHRTHWSLHSLVTPLTGHYTHWTHPTSVIKRMCLTSEK